MWRSVEADITFASAADGFERRLGRWGRHVEIGFTRSPLCTARPGLWREVRALLRRHWDFVQVQSPIAGAVARLALPRRRSYPVVYVAHGFHFHRDGRFLSNLLYRTVEGALAGRGDAVMLVSAEDFDAARTGPIGRRARVYRLPGAGIDVEAFSSAAPERLFPEESLVALVCGELAPAKNPMAAVDAVHEARKRGRDVCLVVAGDGPLRPELEQYLARPDADDWLRHIPFSDQMPALMRGADVLLSTSSREGLPRVLVEALAAGLPIVSVTNRGSRELLAGGLGQVIPQQDKGSLVNALVSFRRGEFPTSEEMGRRADAFSSTRVAAAYSAAVAEVLA
jgi:glycosyltransferase involved in cell wall biosynthesis